MPGANEILRSLSGAFMVAFDSVRINSLIIKGAGCSLRNRDPKDGGIWTHPLVKGADAPKARGGFPRRNHSLGPR